ncbi:hypothetical protein OHD16_19590 [Sphingobacterium sp. ML3W]|uniref:hypothetical protein n=1 Tax=Sphingobacterium sp. ML3W TaxID=1538644 RepID=UPI00249BF72F|nr:hypothetical protein [Sphingobacterium sp. ML3W]WFA82163.1 hypothetical protein OGI71_12730 [Sphingobacterium sp. ML3W]
MTRKAIGDYTLLGYFVKGGHIINSNITSNNVDHAQRYSDNGTNPPYNSKGAEHAPVFQIGNSIHQICNDFSH